MYPVLRVSSCLIGVALWAHMAAASELNPLGFYVGGGVGEATVRDDSGAFAPLGEFAVHDTGWKLFAGLRPLSLVGAEAEYVDFGSIGVGSDLTGRVSLHPRAAAAFGLLYLPLPLPLIDVYAKAGVARLEATGSWSGTPAGLFCPVELHCAPAYAVSRDDTDLAYGIGVQLKLLPVAVRAEYERVDASEGNPDLLSLGVAFSF